MIARTRYANSVFKTCSLRSLECRYWQVLSSWRFPTIPAVFSG